MFFEFVYTSGVYLVIKRHTPWECCQLPAIHDAKLQHATPAHHPPIHDFFTPITYFVSKTFS